MKNDKELLEDLADIMLYEAAKRDDDGERILLSDYLKKRNLEDV